MSSSKSTSVIERIRSFWVSLPDTIRAALFLAAVLVIFAYPFFFQGKQFSAMDMLYSTYPWQAVAPPDFEHPSNSLRGDDVNNYYPIRVNLIRRFLQDGLSFWQADHLSGTPNRPTINWYGELLYPPMWLLVLLPFNTANSLIHILNLLIAGISMWCLLREFELGRIPSLLGATVYMLNGYFVVWMSAYPLPGILALLPLALFLFHRLLHRQQVIYALLIALVISWQFYLGYPPGSILFLVFFGLFCLISLLNLIIQGKRQTAVRTIGYAGLAIGFAIALSALYVIPTVDQLTSSSYMVSRRSGLSTMSLKLLLGFLFPNFWGNPTNAMGRVWQGWGNYCEVIAYFGIVPIVVSVIGFLSGRKRGQVVSFAILSLVFSLSMTYGLWPLAYLRLVPGFSQIVPLRWNIGVVLSGSCLAALGLEHLLGINREKRLGILATIALTAGLFAWIVSTVASPSIIQARFSEYSLLIDSHSWQIGLAVVTLVILALFSLLFKYVPRSILGVLVLVLTIVDLVAFGSGFNPYIADHDLYPETPGIRFLQAQEELHRVAPWGAFPAIFPAEVANVYGIQTITGHDHYRDLAYLDFLKPLMSEKSQSNAQRFGFVRIDQSLETHQPVIDMLNTRYIVTEPNKPNLEQFETVYHGPDMRVYENPSALPRAWGVSQYRLVSSEEALQGVHEEGFDPRQIVLLEQPPALDDDRSQCDFREQRSEIRAYSSDEILIEADFACAGLLVLSERFSPGWQATLDRHDVDILRANYILRAVAVPAGRHTIHLQYRPPTYLWGLGISLCALVLLCGSVGYLWKRWRGAIGVGILVPVIVVLWLGQPHKKAPHPAERWVEINTPVHKSVAPIPQKARLMDGQGEMLFLGYDLEQVRVSPGDAVRLTLYWQGAGQVQGDYTVFTHLVDDSQQLWAQKDKPPLGGAVPTGSWNAGQIIADIYTLRIRDDAPATNTHIAIGMYDWRSGDRVPIDHVRQQPSSK